MTRKHDLHLLYRLLQDLEERVGGTRLLAECDGRMDWPERGVYLFFEPDERREEDEEQLRLTRVGTNAVTEGSSKSLWDQLRDHRGTVSGKYADGGNHRESVFRRHVGAAMLERDGLVERYDDWGEGSSSSPDQREHEHPHEKRVSEYIRGLPFLWVAVDDAPGPESDRAFIERNLVGMLSNFGRASIDRRAAGWLGKHSRSKAVRMSGIWNDEHVRHDYDRDVLRVLEEHAERTEAV